MRPILAVLSTLIVTGAVATQSMRTQLSGLPVQRANGTQATVESIVDPVPLESHSAAATESAEATPTDSQPTEQDAAAQPENTQEAPSALDVPAVTVVGDPQLSYTQSTSNPAMQDGYCQYTFSDGTTQLKWIGRRQTPGPGVVHADLECPSWR